MEKDWRSILGSGGGGFEVENHLRRMRKRMMILGERGLEENFMSRSMRI